MSPNDDIEIYREFSIISMEIVMCDPLKHIVNGFHTANIIFIHRTPFERPMNYGAHGGRAVSYANIGNNLVHTPSRYTYQCV